MQASQEFYLYLKDRLTKIGFELSKVNECLFYRYTIMFMAYADDIIVEDKEMNTIYKVICK